MKLVQEKKADYEVDIEKLIRSSAENEYSFDFSVKNLDCPDCASKTEQAVSRQKGVKSANLNFLQMKLNIEIEPNEDRAEVLKSAISAAKNAHPGIELAASPKQEPLHKSSNEALDDDEEKEKRIMIIRLIVSSVLFGIGFLGDGSVPSLIINLIAYLIIGGEVLLKAFRNILKGKVFDENFLMSVATIGAFFIKSYHEAAAVMLFYQVGEFFQDLSVSKSRKSIKSLMELKPYFANLLVGEEEVKVDPAKVAVGSHIIVKPGERIPIDGIVLQGSGLVDTSALTGESMPREANEGDEVLSGTINLNSVLVLKTIRSLETSAVSRILELVEKAGEKKARTEKFITRFAKYYTPIVVFLALALAIIPPVLTGAPFSGWVKRALAFLVVSCPCALVLSVPLAFFGGIGKASKIGVLVKGSENLERLKNVDTVIFDKTGTLTKGQFSVSEIRPVSPFTVSEVLRYSSYAESFSSHPIAKSILKEFGEKPEQRLISDYEEIAGYGISAVVDNKKILVGKKELMTMNGIEVEGSEPSANTIIYVAVNNMFAGTISIEDSIKSDSRTIVAKLKALGVSKVVMLTGDKADAADKVAGELGIDMTESELLPQDKVSVVERIKAETKGRLCSFVWRRYKRLARACDGGWHCHEAVSAPTRQSRLRTVIMTDEPSLADTIKIARKTNRVVIQNIVVSLAVKAIILILAAMNLASMWAAVFGDVGVAMLAVLNSVRILRSDKL